MVALFLNGCATDPSIAARIQEKSTVYATLKISDRWDISGGYCRMGFTPDMVYMARGTPLKVEVCKFKGDPAEYWTYDLQRFGDGKTPYSLQLLFQNGKVIQARYCPTRDKDAPFEWGES